ncbi:rCG32841 [Rattus norvegicus]|uniref:RCG32841 n=1 Tax=Rattus norvegicus TaxID=10116 RepID=A6HFQ4_RAT|nr:rCG32841 [Rattus norvegicus]
MTRVGLGASGSPDILSCLS